MAVHPMKKSDFDIRVYKTQLRQKYTKLRKQLAPESRQVKDDAIFNHIASTPEYTKCSTVICFVSMEDEIDTHRFIQRCFSDNKTVGVPYCINNSREMDFYFITSIDQLMPRTFGVLEADPETHDLVEDFSDSICIIPGLTFDKYGYRIGYGGGYYDRFLSKKFDGIAKIGVCYDRFVQKRIISGRYDVPCDYIATEKEVLKRKIPKYRKHQDKN